MALQFQRFQSRLLAFLLLPLLGVVAAVYVAVDNANTANAYALITRDLEIGIANFNAAIEDRNDNLAIAGDALSSDFAFRQAWNTDRLTLLSAMENLLDRLVTADFIAMVDADSQLLLADTRRPELNGVMPEWLPLIQQAEALDRQGEYPEAADVIVLDGLPYHLTVLPLLTPDLVGWVVLGFEIGTAFTEEFKQSVSADISVLFQYKGARWQVSGSTLPASLPAALAAAFTGAASDTQYPLMQLDGADYVTLASAISADGNSVQVVLQRSLAAQLQPFEALQQRLFTIFAMGLILMMAALMLVSRNITRPLQLLTGGARRISAGDYAASVEIPHRDEVGQLATAFNTMAKGLAEKEKVRELLGKVVSPEIANELLSKQLELGGEEREVTVMFTDVRGFTALCEGRSPQQILALLNEYFSALTAVIEQHGGVVDKYIGDAVMALFGAPVVYSDAPKRAISAALAVQPALVALNQSFMQRGLKPIAMGIGINTDRVVVGNMGSQSRLNYTAIGDGVNLASRLEGLTKRYSCCVIVSESTAMAAPEFLYLPLDLVRVKGKQEPVRILQPLVERAHASAALLQMVAQFEAFLTLWQKGLFEQANDALKAIIMTDRLAPETDACGEFNYQLLKLYQLRLTQLLTSPPPAWDGIFTHNEK